MVFFCEFEIFLWEMKTIFGEDNLQIRGPKKSLKVRSLLHGISYRGFCRNEIEGSFLDFVKTLTKSNSGIAKKPLPPFRRPEKILTRSPVRPLPSLVQRSEAPVASSPRLVGQWKMGCQPWQLRP